MRHVQQQHCVWRDRPRPVEFSLVDRQFTTQLGMRPFEALQDLLGLRLRASPKVAGVMGSDEVSAVLQVWIERSWPDMLPGAALGLWNAALREDLDIVGEFATADRVPSTLRPGNLRNADPDHS